MNATANLRAATDLLARYRAWHDELVYWQEGIDNAANRDKVMTRILILIEAGPMSDPATWPRR